MARRRLSEGTKYNEQYFRSLGGPGPTAVGVVVILVVVLGLYLAFAKQIPFTGPGYEIGATFENSANIRSDSPVRIAGVNVGKVTSVSREGNASRVQFTVDAEGRPIHADARVKIRPRIFLEGNFFLDVNPGSPGSRELADGDTIPVTQTATAVQLDEVLTALQAPARENLAQLLEGFGTALTYQPTAADDATQDLDVQGESAAEALNDSFDYGGPAGRDTAIVNQALLGTERHDLSGLLRSLGRVSGALISREQQLKDLITNFNTTAGAFAAESDNLAETIRQLPPTLTRARSSFVHLSRALPLLRTFAIELRPGVAQIPATIRAADPWLDQVGPLLTKRELGGIAKLARRGTPGLAGAAGEARTALPRLKLTSRCFAEIVVPATSQVINDPFSTGEPNYKEAFQSFVNLSGELGGFDGNGGWSRFQPAGGPQAIRMPNPSGGFNAGALTGFSIAPPVGTQPPLGPKPAFNSKVACHKSGVPDLNGPAGQIAPPTPGAIP